MNNQVLLWATLVLPWLAVFFMKKEDIKRFMPVALFTIVIAGIAYEFGITMKLWSFRETAYPFTESLPFFMGLIR